MNILTRIARRVVRKLAKPVALWLNARALARAEAQAEHLARLRADILPIEKAERVRAVQLVGRRNEIRAW